MIKPNFQALLLLLLAGIVTFSSCKPDNDDEPVVTIPENYDFANVNHGGQTVRILLFDTLMQVIDGAEAVGGSAVSKADLEAIYDNTPAYYSHISTGKDLSSKVLGGKGGTIDMQIRAWFDSIATRSAKYAGSVQAVTTADGLYLPEMIEKKLMGALMYSQAIGYMNDKVPTADNNTVKEGEGTAMQHNWDEAFGYYGASHYYTKNFTDQEISANPSQKDINNDGRIDPGTERNWFHARYAGSRDRNHTVFTAQPTDFTKAIFENFVKGRHYIGTKEYDKRNEAAKAVQDNWEKVMAASAIHYANSIKTNIADPARVAKPWAEMMLFIEMTQYRDSNILGTARYQELKTLIGTTPAGFTAEKADQIINILKTAYGF